jgi:hypothetical protein
MVALCSFRRRNAADFGSAGSMMKRWGAPTVAVAA